MFNKRLIFTASVGVLFSLSAEQQLDLDFMNGINTSVALDKKVIELSPEERAVYELFEQELLSISKEAYEKVNALIHKHTDGLKKYSDALNTYCKANNKNIPFGKVEVHVSPQLD